MIVLYRKLIRKQTLSRSFSCTVLLTLNVPSTSASRHYTCVAHVDSNGVMCTSHATDTVGIDRKLARSDCRHDAATLCAGDLMSHTMVTKHEYLPKWRCSPTDWHRRNDLRRDKPDHSEFYVSSVEWNVQHSNEHDACVLGFVSIARSIPRANTGDSTSLALDLK